MIPWAIRISSISIVSRFVEAGPFPYALQNLLRDTWLRYQTTDASKLSSSSLVRYLALS